MSDRGADFDAFVLGNAQRLHRIGYALTADRDVAADLVQDVLERMFVKWARIDDPLAYARRALVNATANRWRRQGRRREVPLAEHHDRSVEDGTDVRGQRQVLVQAIAALPPRQRAVIVLRFLEDLSEADTATGLGCSVGTVKSQTARALSRLRDLLPDDDRMTTRSAPC